MGTTPAFQDKICYATGNREIDPAIRHRLQVRIELLLRMLIDCGVTHYIAGGAEGFDTLFAAIVLKLRRAYPAVKLTLMLPSKQYPSKYERTAIIDITRTLVMAQANEIIYIPHTTKRKENALERNDAMIEAGDICVCYTAEPSADQHSGTSYTIRRAVAKNHPVFRITPASDAQEEIVLKGPLEHSEKIDPLPHETLPDFAESAGESDQIPQEE